MARFSRNLIVADRFFATEMLKNLGPEIVDEIDYYNIQSHELFKPYSELPSEL